MEPFRPNLKPMDQVTQRLRDHHYTNATLKSYGRWIRHYIGFYGKWWGGRRR